MVRRTLLSHERPLSRFRQASTTHGSICRFAPLMMPSSNSLMAAVASPSLLTPGPSRGTLAHTASIANSPRFAVTPHDWACREVRAWKRGASRLAVPMLLGKNCFRRA